MAQVEDHEGKLTDAGQTRLEIHGLDYTSSWSAVRMSAAMYLRMLTAVYPMINRRRFQQMEVLEGLNILVTISGRKNKLRVYYLSWLKTKILKTESVTDLCIVRSVKIL